MPTLLDGDFIFVNKFAYGLRLPVVNTKVVSVGAPQRGDVIVFRLPSDPATNYEGLRLPGDHISVRGRQLYINDAPIPVELEGDIKGTAIPARLGVETSRAWTQRSLHP